MDENELVMIADNESTNGHPKVPTDNNVYPMHGERGGVAFSSIIKRTTRMCPT